MWELGRHKKREGMEGARKVVGSGRRGAWAGVGWGFCKGKEGQGEGGGRRDREIERERNERESSHSIQHPGRAENSQPNRTGDVLTKQQLLPDLSRLGWDYVAALVQ